jgi:hypothetical protein
MARIPTSAPADVQNTFKDLWAEIDRLKAAAGLNTDLHGRRVINAGDAIESTDYVTKRQLETHLGAGAQGNGDFVNITVHALARILGTLLMPGLTDGSKHHGLLYVDEAGQVTINEDGAFALDLNLVDGYLELGYDLIVKFFSRAGIGSPTDSVITLRDHAGTGFNGLILGPSQSSSFPGLFPNGSTLEVKKGDGGSFTIIRADKFQWMSSPNYTHSNVTTLRGGDFSTLNASDVRSVLGSLIEDLIAVGILS